ncbi:asparagine synthase (glutamine-hydrolyzing) [Thermus islandicus]|uniref:asparagine synthase (glutamine-hydrolyzing) n=1 Tax=Thermus islandicus TaxID=540988 RepID=UPI0003B4F104|nr:asparagine synthase (glutamine-hydrolyzing) [Thermus islandicus]
MCGIAGLVLRTPDPRGVALLEGLSRTLAHRGPDDKGYLLWGPEGLLASRDPVPVEGFRLGFAHRRLSILDLSEAGWQPMSSPDGRLYVVYNGEVYNFLELRETLEARGHAFRSASDTEVLLAAWREWKEGSLTHLVGMFAFALLDMEENALYLVRDFFGIKPLYYTAFPGGLAFASEIPSLLSLPGVRRRVNPERLYAYLRFGLTDHGGETLFAEVRQVPAGHYLRVPLEAPDRAELVRYWRLFPEEGGNLSFKGAAERLRELFLESVRLHLRSDVPLGFALSGGIDSSAIVCAVRHLEPSLELHAFSFVAEDEGVSEERYVDQVVRACGVRVHKVRIAPEELAQDLDSLVRVQGEPFGSTSIYAQYRVFRRAREEGIKVMLDGQGADELLAGYVPYGAARVASLLASGRLWEALALLQRLSRLPGRGTLWKQVLGRLMPRAFQPLARRLGGEALLPPWLNASWFAERKVAPRPPSRLQGPLKDRLRQELLEALTETSLPMLLRYEDRNSMAHSIESRVPFLTPELAQFVLSLPEGYLLAPDGTSKAVFREAMRGLVPEGVLARKDKIGFATPELRWLRALGPWVEVLLRGEALRSIPALRPEEVLKEWREVAEGRKRFDFRVWRWVNLVAWSEAFGVEYD